MSPRGGRPVRRNRRSSGPGGRTPAITRAAPGAIHARRRSLLLLVCMLASAAVLVRAVELQVVEAAAWEERAAEQHARRFTLPAPRGAILDRNGVPLAVSQEAFRISIAPGELRDRGHAADTLRSVLGISERQARRVVDPSRRWAVVPGLFGAPVRERLQGIRGIHFERVLERFHPHGDVAIELLGRLSGDDRALGGIELEFDSLLTGRPGAAVMRRDARGEPIPGATITVADPIPGNDVYLSIDYDLQEIAHEAIRQAVERTGSAGGDLVLADPWTGEILAAASRQADGNSRWTAVTDPVEPGSTIKPFLVAALLSRRHASMSDSVHAEGGRWSRDGRTITDTHGYEWLSVGEALRVSSNIAMAKLAARMPPADQYDVLRDFGLGTPTGVAYPSESSGRLRRPAEWSRYSQASLAIGYEVSVTPLQLALAYGAIANGGKLMEPRLVREVRSPAGRRIARFEPIAVRRVIPRSVAADVSSALVEVVRGGTGRAASMETFQVAGKTGTARRVESGGYRGGAYTATFAGFFPAVDPQLVFLVKLDRPTGAYYGGSTAAPVTRATLAAALAARSTPLDRRAIALRFADASPEGEHPGSGARRPSAAVVLEMAGVDAGDAADTAAPASTTLVLAPPHAYAATDTPDLAAHKDGAARHRIPDIAGLSMRDAARRLHGQGFAVVMEGSGVVARTSPGAGNFAAAGSAVRVYGREVLR